MFGKLGNQSVGRKRGRKQTYLGCINLALINFNVTMKDCTDITQVDWEFLINNQALLQATAKWRDRPAALKPFSGSRKKKGDKRRGRGG